MGQVQFTVGNGVFVWKRLRSDLSPIRLVSQGATGFPAKGVKNGDRSNVHGRKREFRMDSSEIRPVPNSIGQRGATDSPGKRR